MAICINKLTIALGMLLVSGSVMAHGHHSHGAPMSEAEQKASEGVFDDNQVQNRALNDWDGMWQSVYPYLVSGELDPVFKKKAEKDKSKTAEQIKDYYRKGYATNVDTIGIENDVMEFHTGNQVASCNTTTPVIKFCTISQARKVYVICLSVKTLTAKHLNTCNSAIILSRRVNRATSIFLWEIPRRQPCLKRWKTGRPTTLTS